MSKDRVRIGFLGGGMMTQIAHLPFYLEDPRVEVVGVVEERPSLQEALAKQLGQKCVFSSRESLIKHTDIDAVVISSPRPATGPLTLEVLLAGKHVLAEKPMAHTVDQARRLVNAAAEKKVLYAVGYMKLHDRGVMAAKRKFDEIVSDGRLGALLSARFYNHSKSYAEKPPPHIRPQESRIQRYPVWPEYPDWLPEQYRKTYAWFLNSASHDVSLLRYFFPDNVEVISAVSSVKGAVWALMCADEVPITLDIAKSECGQWLEGAEFLFECGRLSLTIPSPMAVNKVAKVEIDDLNGNVIGAKIATDGGWSFKHQSKAFIDSLTGTGPLVASGKEGLADMELTETIWHHIEGLN